MSTLKHANIIQQMSLEEKVSLLSGKDFWQTKSIERLGIKSLFLADGPHGVRRQAVDSEQPGLNTGIPATCFPTAATVANSWNVELGEKVGAFLGDEASAQKVNVLLGPGVNIKRNPLCGRNFEYFSEDPYLSGKMAAAYIRGIQSQGIAACVKHFAVSNQEWRIMTVDTVVDERTLREIYLTAFEIAVKEGHVKAVMSAYNKVNGIYATEHPHLMNGILRDEWGYRGCVITNWGGGNNRVSGLKAGNELEMPGTGGETDRDVLDAIHNGEISEELLDASIDRLLDLIFSTDAVFKLPKQYFNSAQHHRVSQRVAEESIVLLKNEDGILPLDYTRKVAVIGDFAQNARYQGSGSSIVNPAILDHTLDCLDESGIKSIGYEPGFDRYGKKSPAAVAKAQALAAKADTVLLYLGLDEVSEAQGIDRSDMKLPENQTDLLDAIYAVNPNIVVILSCGCAIEMPWIGKIKGLLHGYLGGQAGARAILRVISGDVNPSGKLAESYPLLYQDTPSASNFPGNDLTVEYREGLFVGYRYFDTASVEVLFPFGYGLSYTTFQYSHLEVLDDCVRFRITNSGNVSGMEVAQLYIGKQDSRVFRPRKELKGFVKVFINAGDSKCVTIPFDDKSFRYFNIESGTWEVEAGEYQVMIGSSCAHIHLTSTTLQAGTEGEAPSMYDPSHLPHYYSGSIQDVPDHEFSLLLGRQLPQASRDSRKPLGYDDAVSLCRYARGWMARAAFWTIHTSYRFLKGIGRRDTANMIMMSVYNLPFHGIARMSGGRVDMPMVDGLLLMANGKSFKGLTVFFRAWRKKRKKGR